MYLDQWSPPKEESKQIGRDVITDHYGDRDNEPAEENFHSIRKSGGKIIITQKIWSIPRVDGKCVRNTKKFHFDDGATFQQYCTEF